jgi:hypothetical protein
MRLSDIRVGDVAYIDRSWTKTKMTSTKGYLKGGWAIVKSVTPDKNGFIQVWNTSAVPTFKSDGSPDVTTYRLVHPDDISDSLRYTRRLNVTYVSASGVTSNKPWADLCSRRDYYGLPWLPNVTPTSAKITPDSRIDTVCVTSSTTPDRYLQEYKAEFIGDPIDDRYASLSLPKTTIKESSTMDKMIAANKDALITTAQIKVGRVAINGLAKLVKNQVPFYVKGYIDHPIAKFVIGNTLVYGLDKFGDRCTRFSPSDICELKHNVTVAAQLELAEVLDLDALVKDVFKAVDSVAAPTTKTNKAGHQSQNLDTQDAD